MAEAHPWLCLHRTSLKMLALVPKVRVAGPALWVRRSQASADAQYAAFVQNVKNHQSTGLYMEYTTVEYDANKAYKSGINYILAADRNDIYLKNEVCRQHILGSSVVFGTVENNTEWLYALYEKVEGCSGRAGSL